MSRYDALNTIEDNEGGSAVQVSIFKENYQYARRQGMTHTEARNYAIDYHRKFTAREATDNWAEFAPTVEDESITAFDYVLFNQLVKRLDEQSSAKQAEFLFLFVRLYDLEMYLDERNMARSVEICGEFYPEEVKDIARRMGFVIRSNGSCNSMARYRRHLQGLASVLR